MSRYLGQGIPKCAADGRILGWPVSLPAAGRDLRSRWRTAAPAAPKFRFASEPAVALRSGWSGHCLQIAERVFTTLRLRKTQDKCHVKVSGTEEP